MADKCTLCLGEGVTADGHPQWFTPAGTGRITGLQVNNSLTETKVPFIPMEGNVVKWYTCGPTVYDVAHMGHARAYLTFDIIRRILEDYFHYEVVYQMNVTDIDDKIIKRARQGKLLQDYKDAKKGFDKVCADVEEAITAHDAKLKKKLVELMVPLDASTAKRLLEERETLLKEQHLKVEQVADIRANVAAAKQTGDVTKVMEAGRDPLMDLLDFKLGEFVTDHSVFDAHAKKYEASFLRDIDALGIRRPDLLSRVSEYVPQVVTFIEKLVGDGYAYEANGSVYFNTRNFRSQGFSYPKLKRGEQGSTEMEASEAEMAEGEGSLSSSVGDDKRSPNDFALWKKSKAGEPFWGSPWGKGRPGWHIECSVMASEVLGNNMDIHAGGSDLKFPHHDNELAQSEACHGCKQWVNYFFHAGHLNIRGLKMSKSLKNFVTIQQALEEHTPRQLRLMFLLQSWDKAMYYSDQVVDDAKSKESLFKNFFGSVKAVLRKGCSSEEFWRTEERDLQGHIAHAQSEVHKGLCDNFDTVRCMQALCNLVSDTNKYLADCKDPRAHIVTKAARFVTSKLRLFGVIEGYDDIGFPAAGAGGDMEGTVSPYLDAFSAFRDTVREEARGAKLQSLLEACDNVRDQTMVELGVRLEDVAGQPSVWKLDDPDTLRREVEEKRAKAAEAAAAKVRNKIDKLTKEIGKWEVAKMPADQLFKTGSHAGKFSEFDEKHMPTKLAGPEGGDVSKKASKAYEKEMVKHLAAMKQLEDKGGDAFLKTLTDELAQLQLQL